MKYLAFEERMQFVFKHLCQAVQGVGLLIRPGGSHAWHSSLWWWQSELWTEEEEQGATTTFPQRSPEKLSRPCCLAASHGNIRNNPSFVAHTESLNFKNTS